MLLNINTSERHSDSTWFPGKHYSSTSIVLTRDLFEHNAMVQITLFSVPLSPFLFSAREKKRREEDVYGITVGTRERRHGSGM